MHKSKTKWICLDCRENTSKMKEHYFVHTALWMKIVNSEKGMLCIGCFEKRLGRLLVASDFTDAHINDPRKNAMSMRLRNRLMSGTV